MSNFMVMLVKLLSTLLSTVRKHENCPDGICEEPLALATTLETQLKSPNVSVGIFDLIGFLRCFPLDRVVAVFKRIGVLLRDCQKCPDGECSFFDILSCLNLRELVSIVNEILAIIRDSQLCRSDNGTEITLGQASS